MAHPPTQAAQQSPRESLLDATWKERVTFFFLQHLK
jgi:hypothetical protein